MTKEAELTRKIQIQAEKAKRDVTGIEPRLDKCLLGLNSIAKCFSEIGKLDNHIQIEAQKTLHFFDSTETNMNMLHSNMN